MTVEVAMQMKRLLFDSLLTQGEIMPFIERLSQLVENFPALAYDLLPCNPTDLRYLQVLQLGERISVCKDPAQF